MSTVLERALEARVIQLEAEVEALTPPAADELAERDDEAAAYHAGVSALAYQLGTHVDADIVKAVHDSSPYGAEHRKKHIELSERVKQLEGELRHYRGEVPPMLASLQPQAAAASLPFDVAEHVTAPVPDASMRLNEVQKREFLIANGWTVHPEIEDQNIRVCWENGSKWLTLGDAYDLVVADQKKARLREAGWARVVDEVDEIERWRRPADGELVMFHLAEA